jgi:integrase
LITGRGFENAAAKVGIEGVGSHSIHAAFCSRGINSIVPTTVMTHKSSTITERRYIHLFDRERTDEQVRAACSQQYPGDNK